MAEERLIDDDKDRKYKIRINENGEEELVIDESAAEEEESDIPVFEIPVDGEDDEEAALLTPEQLAERERIKKEEEQRRSDRLETLRKEAQAKWEENDFEGALYAVTRAEELTSTDGGIYCLKLKILSRNLTEFNSPDSCAEAADGVKEYATAEQKAELKELNGVLTKRIEEVKVKTAELEKINEAGKEERRADFARLRTKTLAGFVCTVVPFLVFTVLAIVFATQMFADENGTYIILTAVFGALAVVMLAATAFSANRFWTAQRYVNLNERDNTTKAGRAYLESKNELDCLTRVSEALE